MADLKLEDVKECDLEQLKELEIKSFEINRYYFTDGVIPCLNEDLPSYNLFHRLYNDEKYNIFKIIYDGVDVGGIIIKNINETIKKIELLFIISSFQNKGIGKNVVEKIENMYPNISVWFLSTPIAVTKNIYFYIKKCGYHIVDIESYDKHTETGMFVFRKEKYDEKN